MCIRDSLSIQIALLNNGIKIWGENQLEDIRWLVWNGNLVSVIVTGVSVEVQDGSVLELESGTSLG